MEIRYANLIRNSKAYKSLVCDCDKNALAHTYVFVSPDKVGLKLLTNFFLAKVIGESDITLKRVFSNGYLDIINLPQNFEGKANAKMTAADADYVADTCYMTGAELDYKYYILGGDEPISEAVQNKLLKILEEPPSVARFILHASTDTELLPTIYSRARIVRLDAFSADDIFKELSSFYTDDVAISIATAACRGQIGLAQDMVTNLRYKHLYEKAYTILKFMKRSPEILPYAAAIISLKDYLPQFIDFLELLLMDVCALNSKADSVMSMKNNHYDIKSLADDYPLNTCLKLLPVLNTARARLKANCNANSIVDQLLFSILEVKAKCQK